MKKATVFLSLILFCIVGCREQEFIENDDFILVDVTKDYSYKKELILQDFMDVEYISLETNDEFVNQGFVQAIGKEIIVVKNYKDDGDIFIYDRTGKAIRKINRKGQGGEEYTFITNIILDEYNNEIFVNDHFTRKIIVYDFYGNFKRSFKHKENIGYFFYTEIYNYNNDFLICNDIHSGEIGFVLIYKNDGSIFKEINIPFKEKKLLMQFRRDETADMVYSTRPGTYPTVIPNNDNWILLDISSDTIYTFLEDYSLCPFLVRTPSVQSMEPEVFLILRLLSDRYYFMESIKNAYNWETKSGFQKTFFMYDTQENVFSGYTVYNGDFSIPNEIYMSVTRPVNHEIESWYSFEAYQLVESYNKGELKGNLKEIAARLDDESNPVIMLIKHKK